MDDYPGDSNDHSQDGKPIMDGSFTDEIATEIADPDSDFSEHDDPDLDVNNVYGWIAIAASIVSFFFIPILFAGAGIILGFIARNRGASMLGYTAITLSIIALLVRLFVLPFF